jgi:hypothetical protein
MMGGPQLGKASVGMVSQDSGTLGQVDYCPVAVRLSPLQT